MDAIRNMFILCILMGSVGLSFFLVVTAVLRWLAVEKNVRRKRLNILAGIAAAGLLIVFLCIKWDAVAAVFVPTAGGNMAADTTGVFIEIAKFAIKLLLLGIAVVSVALLSSIVVLFLYHGLKAVATAAVHKDKDKSLADKLNGISDNLRYAIKSPIFAASITWGLLAFLIFLPLLVGNADDGSVIGNWKSGIVQIVESEQVDQGNANQSEALEQADQNNPDLQKDSEETSQRGNTTKLAFYVALTQYILFAIIVLGVSFAAFKLLYSIISRTFKENRNRELIDEYSIEIGVLSVGVATLWMVQNENLEKLVEAPSFELVLEFLKAFAVVILVVTLIVLTLEVIRLLLDMREKLIRQEARLLFISLAGEVTLLLLFTLHSLYDAVNNALGNTNDHTLDRIETEVKGRIVEAMDEQLSKTKEHKRTFTVFDEVVTKADEGEET